MRGGNREVFCGLDYEYIKLGSVGYFVGRGIVTKIRGVTPDERKRRGEITRGSGGYDDAVNIENLYEVHPRFGYFVSTANAYHSTYRSLSGNDDGIVRNAEDARIT